MIIFLTGPRPLERSLRQVLALMPMGRIMRIDCQLTERARRVFAVGRPCAGVILQLLESGIEVIEVTDGICKAVGLIEIPGTICDRRNLTVATAGHQLHQDARVESPELLRPIIDRIVHPLVFLGYIQQVYENALREWASRLTWSPEQRAKVASILVGQSNYLKRLAI
jgi:hypothetical protein